LVAVSARLAIIRFDHPQEAWRGSFFFPAGSYTLGFFWAGRHYNLYRFTRPDGAVIVYRFDVVDAVQITPQHVRYTDLLLDAWLPPGGPLRVEDADEAEAAARAGLLSPRRRAIIERTHRLLERAWPRIIAEAERELTLLGAER
jgi:predicted RNA-binding protein associated with RNAse of E/G family